MPRSTPATQAARWSTPRATWSASTPRSTHAPAAATASVSRCWIGVEPRELTAEFIENFKLAVKQGVLIAGVLQDGPASKGGIKPGDVVVKVAGQPVTSVAQLLDSVAALPPGKPAKLVVQRGAKALELTVDIIQRKPPAARRQ